MKQIKDMRVVENQRLHPSYSLLKLSPVDETGLPDILPGQFVQVAIEGSKTTFLRRPISINFVDKEKNQLWLLVRKAGDGTRHLCEIEPGKTLNIVMPLGNGFSFPETGEQSVLLIGGGVGVAPLLQFGKELKDRGFRPEFLLGARSRTDLLELDEFARYGTVHISTDDGSFGEKGVVTLNSVLSQDWDNIYCCGPAPMMKAVAGKVRQIKVKRCEVSLENMMACGIGACLCCVENTVRGNVCVCTEGPVFNIDELTW